MEKYNKNKFFSSLILLLLILTSSLKLNAQQIIEVNGLANTSNLQFNEGETTIFSISDDFLVENDVYPNNILWDVNFGGADYDINQMDGRDFEVTWNEYSVGSNVRISVEFYGQPNKQGIYYYQETGWITIAPTGTNWYPDSDGDGFGDLYTERIRLNSNLPGPSGYAPNTLDQCPYFYSTENNGCGTNYENRNWITSKAYDINGTLKASSKAYFNDLGKGTQSQTLDVKTSRTWATQTLYDTQGRPALSTLSAPINNTGTITYKTDFIKNNSDAPYTSSDFEGIVNNINKTENPSTVGIEEYTLGRYYSSSNSTEPYQDVTDYPFSRTIYSELNPGAALKTLGGNKVDTNNDGTPDNWVQGYTFSMPAGDELTQSVAFGDASYKVDTDRKIIKTISKDAHNNEAVVFTDSDGKTLAAARVGGASFRNTVVKISEQGYVDVHVPTNTTGFTINGVSGINTEVYDLITEQTTATATGSLLSGFYRISITNLDSYNPNSNAVTITCKENYYDYSLNEYDEAGRLTASYQPVGATKAQKPKSTFKYNALGQLTQTHSPDEGDAWFLYRKDGQIRFSVNSKQWQNKEFSYTNYDDLGRPVTSGVYKDDTSYYLQTFGHTAGPFKSTLTNVVDSATGPTVNYPDNQEEENRTTYDEASGLDFYIDNNLLHSDYGNPTFLAGNVAMTENNETTTWYSYDVYGRVKWIVQEISGLGVKTIDYEYDPITSQVTRVVYQKDQSDQFIHRYTYDTVDNSLVKVETSTNGSTYTTHADYKYYETGALKRVEIAPLNGEPLQGIDYVYNLNGQLKAINPGNDASDLFSMQIDYHTNDYARSVSSISTPIYGQDQFNGNIKGVRWNNKDIETNNGNPSDTEQTYSYYYNKNNWLTDAVYGQYGNTVNDGSKVSIVDSETYIGITKNLTATQSITLLPGFHAKPDVNTNVIATIGGTPSTFQSGDYNVFDITYDANGNIRTLNRNKNGTSKAMDQLNYTYKADKPNQLLRVDDAAGDVAGADDIGDQDDVNYKYNSIGQLIEDHEYVTIADPTNIIRYKYNASGLVTEVSKKNVPLVKFFYNDKGHRVKKEAYISGSTNLDYIEHYVRDAAGTALAIYRDGAAKEHTIYGASRLGVYYRTGGGNSVYQLTDHLGNVRAVVQRNNGIPEAIVATDYYPFGMPMPGRNDGANSYRYAYQGQEKDSETGKEAFQLRLWDSRIGRWLTTDPMGEFHSPYLGMGNNPISKIDPTGGSTMDPPTEGEFANGQPWTDSDGSWKYNASSNVWEGLNGSSDIFGSSQTLGETTIYGVNKNNFPREFGFTGNNQLDFGLAGAYRDKWNKHFEGFAANYDAGWNSWKKGDLGYDVMHFTSVALAGTMTLPVASAAGGSMGFYGLADKSITLAARIGVNVIKLDAQLASYVTQAKVIGVGTFSQMFTRNKIGFSGQRFILNNFNGMINFMRYHYNTPINTFLTPAAIDNLQKAYDTYSDFSDLFQF